MPEWQRRQQTAPGYNTAYIRERIPMLRNGLLDGFRAEGELGEYGGICLDLGRIMLDIALPELLPVPEHGDLGGGGARIQHKNFAHRGSPPAVTAAKAME